MEERSLNLTLLFTSHGRDVIKQGGATGFRHVRQFSGRDLNAVASQKEARMTATQQRCLMLANLLQNFYP